MTELVNYKAFVYYVWLGAFFINFQFIWCSLLSRFKNHYQYIPQEHNNTFADDLYYDFQFTSSHIHLMTNKQDPEELYNGNENLSDEKLNYDLRVKLLNNNGIVINKTNQLTVSVSRRTQQPRLSYRPTIHSSLVNENISISRRKTWPSYFPKYTLPRSLQNSLITSVYTTLRSSQKNIVLFKPSPYTLMPWQQRHNLTKINFTKRKPYRTTFKTTRDNTTIKTYPTLPAFIKNIMRTSVKSSCYSCGLNETKIPKPYCYSVFDGDDERNRKLKRNFKVKCIQSTEVKQIKNKFFGPGFRVGCFKRFLDTGTEYNERGCRTRIPMRGKSFASKRLAKLETLLKDEEDGCIFSPHASITPFSRAISIYSRYHVCVCSTKYCNKAFNKSKSHYLTSYFTTLAILLSL